MLGRTWPPAGRMGSGEGSCTILASGVWEGHCVDMADSPPNACSPTCPVFPQVGQTEHHRQSPEAMGADGAGAAPEASAGPASGQRLPHV